MASILYRKVLMFVPNASTVILKKQALLFLFAIPNSMIFLGSPSSSRGTQVEKIISLVSSQ